MYRGEVRASRRKPARKLEHSCLRVADFIRFRTRLSRAMENCPLGVMRNCPLLDG